MATETIEKKNDPRRVTLVNVQGSFFSSLAYPKATIQDGPKKHGANFIMDPATEHGKANIRKCRAAIEAAEKAAFNGETGIIEKVLKKDVKRVAFRKGEFFTNEDGDIYGGYEGMYGLATKNGKRPKLLDRRKEIVLPEDVADVFLAGMDFDAIVSFYCTNSEKQGGRGLFCTVELVRARGTGEPFGSGGGVSDDEIEGLEDLPEDDGFDEGTGSSGSASEDDEF